MHELVNNYHIAVPTAFFADEEMNTEATMQHIMNLYGQGVRSVLICGTTGEQHSLSLAEKLRLLEAINRNEGIPADLEIIFGVAGIRQKEAVALAEAVNVSAKISGVMLGFPPYIMPSQREAATYVQAIAAAVDKPIILYNNPRRTAFNLELETFSELLNVPNIVGIKEAGDSDRIPALLSVSDGKIAVYAGGEIDLSKKIKLGVTRLSSMTGNLYPKEVEAYFVGLMQGDPEQDSSVAIEAEIGKVFAANPIVYLKNEITKRTTADMGIARSPIGN